MSGKYVPAWSVDDRLNVQHLTENMSSIRMIIAAANLSFYYSLATAATVLCPLIIHIKHISVL